MLLGRPGNRVKLVLASGGIMLAIIFLINTGGVCHFCTP